MKYRVTESNGTVMAALEGSLNFAANEEFHLLLEKIVSMKPRHVILNLSGLTGIDSVGLGLLYIAYEDLELLKAKLTLASPGEGVARLLELTEAHLTFEIVP